MITQQRPAAVAVEYVAMSDATPTDPQTRYQHVAEDDFEATDATIQEWVSTVRQTRYFRETTGSVRYEVPYADNEMQILIHLRKLTRDRILIDVTISDRFARGGATAKQIVFTILHYRERDRTRELSPPLLPTATLTTLPQPKQRQGRPIVDHNLRAARRLDAGHDRDEVFIQWAEDMGRVLIDPTEKRRARNTFDQAMRRQRKRTK